jgi:Uma2 family endonuclease
MYIDLGFMTSIDSEVAMTATVETASPFTSSGELKRLLVDLLPGQGNWSEEEYLWLTDHTNRLVEFTDGNIEVLPMPTDRHQTILEFLFLIFNSYLRPLGGKAHMAGTRLRVGARKFREPDLIALRSAKDPRRQDRYWKGADLTLEVVSKDKRERDLIDKRGDYAEGGVPEYWIVNPFTETITVLRLEGKAYVEHGVLGRGTTATSALLTGFAVDVDAVMDAD